MIAFVSPAFAADAPFPAPDTDFQGMWLRTDQSAPPLPVHYLAKAKQADFELPNGDQVLVNVNYGVAQLYGPSIPHVIVRMPIHHVQIRTGHPTDTHRRIDGVSCRVWYRFWIGNRATLCLAAHDIPLAYSGPSRSYKLTDLEIRPQDPNAFSLPEGRKVIDHGPLLDQFYNILMTPF